MSSLSAKCDFREMAHKLTESVSLSLPPVAVCFVDQVPEGVNNWLGRAPAGCRFWQEAATTVFATSPDDHGLCSIGMFTHNLKTTPEQDTDRDDSLKVFADLEYVREQDIPTIPVLKSRFAHIIYGPLASVPLPPDIVLLFGKAGQMLILSEATQQVEGGLPPAMGRPACAIIPQAFNTGRAALSLGCCGARTYLDVLTDEVALWAIPGPKLSLYVERVSALAKANNVLTAFHHLRRSAVEDGKSPTIRQSLIAMSNGTERN
ncbi:MAG TPA: DUF169 domain-containing protein [Bryobacteraceae bacterium]|nr:DUF169 domain-containing protein [Bryobacteraceae bacterium]